MGRGFVVFKDSAVAHGDRTVLVDERTHSPAIRTSLLRAELAGLLLSGDLQGASQQGPHSGHGDVFHLGQVDIESGALLAPILPHDDFSPAFGQFLDALEIVWIEFARRHADSLQGDPSISPDEMLSKACLARTPAAK